MKRVWAADERDSRNVENLHVNARPVKQTNISSNRIWKKGELYKHRGRINGVV
jgi:hypothetical protein